MTMTENVKTALAELNTTMNRIEELQAQTDRQRKAMVEKYCTVQIGDIATATGYTYRGKKMRVTAIILKQRNRFRNEPRCFVFHVMGSILNKDGTPSAINRGETEFNLDMTPTS